MTYYQLESNITGLWEPAPTLHYFANDFRALLNFLQLGPGQRLRKAERPEKGTRIWVFNAKEGLMQWVN